MEIALLILLILVLIVGIYIAIKLNKQIKENSTKALTEALDTKVTGMEQKLIQSNIDQQEQTRKHNEEMNSLLRDMNRDAFHNTNTQLNSGLEAINKTLEARLAAMTETQENSFRALRDENNQQIDKIRETVSEKLDKTLNEQFDKSFKGVLTQMSELQKTMGELKGISNQVGSLEKTLNGVKTRGISGEVQLKQIIADVLTPKQYDIEVATKPESKDHVEIAVKIPSKDGEGFYYLPIDSKCHLDLYEALVEAYNTGDTKRITEARRLFADAIKKDANDIASKYICEPYTTPNAILFVPFEGMYSEIVNLNLLEALNALHVSVAGPYTLIAILSTVTNYYQALAIEKKSTEIEITLGKVKKEFSNYEVLLTKAKNNLRTASNQLDELSETRTRAVNRALRSITMIDEGLPDTVDLTKEDEDTEE